MAVDNGFLTRLVTRLGLSGQIPSALLIEGEIAFTLDDKSFWVGDGTSNPPKFMSTKSTGDFDFSSVTAVTLPGGAVFNNEVNSIGTAISNIIDNSPGFLVKTGNNIFNSISFISRDESIVIEGEDGQGQEINIIINQQSNSQREFRTEIIQSIFGEDGETGIRDLSDEFDSLKKIQNYIVDTLVSSTIRNANEIVRLQAQVIDNEINRLVPLIRNGPYWGNIN